MVCFTIKLCIAECLFYTKDDLIKSGVGASVSNFFLSFFQWLLSNHIQIYRLGWGGGGVGGLDTLQKFTLLSSRSLQV